MKKFAKNISIISVIIVFVFLCLEIFYRFSPNNYTEKHKYIKEGYNDTEVLVFGNSHAFYGINPVFFELKTFNISNISQTLLYDKLLFEKHIDSLQKLKYIILPIEYTSLSHDNDIGDLKWRKYFYEAQMGINTGLISDLDIKKYFLALSPRLKITVEAIKKYFKNGTIADCTNNGFASYIGVNKINNNNKAANIIMNKHEDNSVDFHENLNIVNYIINKCKQKGVKVIIVNMPVTTYYAEKVNKEKREKIIEKCSKLDGQSNVYYLDVFQNANININDFHDVDHLNVEGAKKCSNILNAYIMSINNN
ncbi:hypothetical protein D3C87_404820 [compost metagenome]